MYPIDDTIKSEYNYPIKCLEIQKNKENKKSLDEALKKQNLKFDEDLNYDIINNIYQSKKKLPKQS